MIKCVFVGNIQVTYNEQGGRFYIVSVVTHGNFVEQYNERVSFDSKDDLVRWAQNQYNK